jgi:hypothetical protein
VLQCFLVRYELDDFDEDNSDVSSEDSSEEHEDDDEQCQPAKNMDQKPDFLWHPGVCFPILDLLTVPLHQHNRHKFVSGGRKGKGVCLPLQVLGNPRDPNVHAEDALTHLTKTLYIYLKETYAEWFDEVFANPCNVLLCVVNTCNALYFVVNSNQGLAFLVCVCILLT